MFRARVVAFAQRVHRHLQRLIGMTIRLLQAGVVGKIAVAVAARARRAKKGELDHGRRLRRLCAKFKPRTQRDQCAQDARTRVTAIEMPKLFCFGLGFSAQALAARLKSKGWRVAGTTRTRDRADALGDPRL